MTPFEQYMSEAKQIREYYRQLIEQNPAQKDRLLSEMNSILNRKLDECEQKEIERSKHV